MPSPQQVLRHREAAASAKRGSSNDERSPGSSYLEEKEDDFPQSVSQSLDTRSSRRLFQRTDTNSHISRQRTSPLISYLFVAFIISCLFVALHSLSTKNMDDLNVTDLSRSESLRLWKRFIDDEDRKDMLRSFRAALDLIGDERGVKILPMHDYDNLNDLILQQHREAERVRERLAHRIDEIERYRAEASSAKIEREQLKEAFLRPDAHKFHLWCGRCRWGQGDDMTECDTRLEYVVQRYKKSSCWIAKKETIEAFPDRCLLKDERPDIEESLRAMRKKWWDWPENSPLRKC